MSSNDDLKSNAHVWGGESPPEQEAMAIQDAPPAYESTTPVTAETSQQQQQQRPNLPTRPKRKPVSSNSISINREPYNPILALSQWARTPWNKYIVPDATVSGDRTIITTTHTQYVNNQQALIKLLADQADLPPLPMVRIVGSHISGSAGSQTVDFDLTINLSPLLDLSRPPRWHNKPAQIVPPPGPSDNRSPASSAVTGNNTVQLESSARQFLKDKSDRKSLVLTRTVDNLPIDVIEGLVRNLMASIHYRGKLVVSFPIHCGQLIIQKKPGGAGAAVGGWFMNVLGLSPDVKYETLERVWELGSSSSGPEVSDEVAENMVNDAGPLVKEWWNAWAPAVRDAVLLKRKGKVGVEDWMEAQMGWRPVPTNRDWGVDYISS